MDAFSSVAASRPLWSKTLHKKKPSGHIHRKEPVVTLPVLARRTNVQQLGTNTRNNSLHAFLTSQLEGNDREAYSRSQLRAMASSKLLSNSNNNLVPIHSRIHSYAERLAPLDQASFEKTKTHQHRTLPGPLQAAINEVLAVRNSDDLLSERGESRDDSSNADEPETPIPRVKLTSPNKSQLQGRRPEWRRYIRRIMMTKGIQGSTLARYRRLVGIVARKNLIRSYANAAERVVRYRLEFRSAAMIQTMIIVFLKRRRQEKALRKHQAAAKIQREWRMVIERDKQRQLVNLDRLVKLDRLLRLGATRSIQRTYRKYRHNCYLREEDQRQLLQASKMQKARLKLLQRCQMWKKNSKRDKIDRYLTFTAVGKELSGDRHVNVTEKENYGSPERMIFLPCDHIEVIMTCGSITADESSCDSVEAHQDILDRTEVISDTRLRKNSESSDGPMSARSKDFVTVPQQDEAILLRQDQSTGMEDNSTTDPHNDENQIIVQDGLTLDDSAQDSQDTILPHSSSCSEPNQSSLEIVTVAVEAIPELENDNERGDYNSGVDEMEKIPTELSDPEDHLQSPTGFTDVVDENSVLELAPVATTTAMARTKAAQRIARFLLPMLQVRRVKKSLAAIHIQCFVRLYLARQRMVRVRLEALTSLRQQLRVSWEVSLQDATKENLIASKQSTHVDQNEDEDDELDMELRGYQPTLHGVSDVYIHVLTTRNGQIPPGVPLLQSSAGAPLLSLWKWSWSGEKWVSNVQ